MTSTIQLPTGAERHPLDARVRADRRIVNVHRRCCGMTFTADTKAAADALHIAHHAS